MKQSIIELDKKGILPLEKEKEDNFYERGNQFLDTAYDFKRRNSKMQADIKYALNDFQEQFLTSPDWVSCEFKKIDQSNTPKGFVINGTTGNKRYKKMNLPVVELDEIVRKKENVIRHELIHSVRFNLEKSDSMMNILIRLYTPFFMNKFGQTPEAFAYSLEGSTILNSELDTKNKFLKFLIGWGLVDSIINFSSGNIFAGIVSGVSAFGSLNFERYSSKSERNTKLVYKRLNKLKKINCGDKQDPEIKYSLLRMTNVDVVNLDNYLQRKSYEKFYFKNYIKEQSSDKLRFKIMAERLG